MAMNPLLSRVAVVRGDLALVSFRSVIGSGGNDLTLLRLHGRALDAWHATTRATYAADVLGQALKHGIQDPAYQKKLVGSYQSAMDELPDAVE